MTGLLSALETENILIITALSKLLLTQSELAIHKSFIDCSTKLFKCISDGTDEVVLRALEVIYCVSNRNKEFVKRVSEEALIHVLFERAFKMIDYITVFFSVILSFVRQDSLIVKQLINNKRYEKLIEILKGSYDKSVKIRAAYILKATSIDPEHGETFTKQVLTNEKETGNIWSNYKETQLPPLNQPLTTDINQISTITTSTELQEKLKVIE